jgi:hypothetical protein
LNYFNYFSEIEEAFIRRRGKALMVSPKDWTIIEDWQKRGIPQHIVIRSIEKIFDDIAKDPARNPSVKSIAYCSDEVERQYRDWQASQAGAHSESDEDAHDESGKEGIAEHLTGLITALNDSLKTVQETLRPALSEAIKGLEKLNSKSEFNSEKIEQELTILESAVDKALLENADASELSEAQKSVEDHLGQYAGKMQQDVYDKTFELMLMKKLRAKAGIPAFSLFYL